MRTQAGVISATLKSSKVQQGRSGSVTQYTAQSVSSGSKFASLLPIPTLSSLDGKVPEEKPLEFKFSGFMTAEYEHSERFGYDTGTTTTTAAPNFSEKVDRPRRSTGSLFSNFNFSLQKDRTSIQSILEVGEIYFGDSATGGAQGARASNLLEVRNFYLEHSVTDYLKAKAGIITVGTDPRGFIYADHTASAQLAYESTLANAQVWYGTAQKSRPAAANYLHDSFLSVQANLNFLFGLKNTIFYTERNQANATLAQAFKDGTFGALTGRNQAHWLGGTFAYSPEDFTFELRSSVTGIASVRPACSRTLSLVI